LILSRNVEFRLFQLFIETDDFLFGRPFLLLQPFNLTAQVFCLVVTLLELFDQLLLALVVVFQLVHAYDEGA
jgi:hypothetical protein